MKQTEWVRIGKVLLSRSLSPSLELFDMALAPLRLRGPNGISTIQVGLEDPATVADLQQAIFDATQVGHTPVT